MSSAIKFSASRARHLLFVQIAQPASCFAASSYMPLQPADQATPSRHTPAPICKFEPSRDHNRGKAEPLQPDLQRLVQQLDRSFSRSLCCLTGQAVGVACSSRQLQRTSRLPCSSLEQHPLSCFSYQQSAFSGLSLASKQGSCKVP